MMAPRRNAGPTVSQSEESTSEKLTRELIEELEGKKPKNENDKMALSVAKVLVPIITTVVSKSCEPSVSKSLKYGAGICKKAYDLDKLQQYGRRENMRIAGLPETENENVREKVNNIGQRIGVTIPESAINVVHRTGPRGGPRPPRMVLVRFASREVKYELLRNKKNLKDIPDLKGIFIGEDLTPLRAKLLRKVKSLPNVKNANTKDGIIHCNMNNGSHVIVESPDDLFHVGLDEVDYNELGLQYL